MKDVGMHRSMFTEMSIIVQQRVVFTGKILNAALTFIPEVINHDGLITAESLVETGRRSFGCDLVKEIRKDFGVRQKGGQPLTTR